MVWGVSVDFRQVSSGDALHRGYCVGPLSSEASFAMLAKRVILCLDVDRGRVVKGTKEINNLK